MDDRVYKHIKIRNYLSDEIYKIRKSNKLTQKEFAKLLNVSLVTISNIENRKCLPTPRLIRDISTKFGEDADLLYKIFQKGEEENERL